MVLSDIHIEKLQQLYAAQFGKNISKQEAYESGIKLLQLVMLIYTPMTLDDFLQVQKERKELGLPEITNALQK